jgi:hypothetical protein
MDINRSKQADALPVVTMLLRIDFDSGKTRTNLFRDCQAFDRKIVLLDRIAPPRCA